MATTPTSRASPDAIVVGAGFGGLGAGLRLAELGAKVLVLEALSYPGGCAGTFERGGARFEAGATLFSGLGPNGLFGRWIERYGLDVAVELLDPIVELRTPRWRLPVHRDREDFLRRLAAICDVPLPRLRPFFAHQRRVADTLWRMLEDPRLLPPFGGGALLAHARRLPSLLEVLRDAGRPLGSMLRRFDLDGIAPLRTLLDSLCQITVQCPADRAEAPFALGALDYLWRDTGHVRGGIGELASGLVDAIGAAGGEVRTGRRVRSIVREGDRWRVETGAGSFRAEHVVANLLPQRLEELLHPGAPRRRALLRRRVQEVEGGWGACVLYLVLEAEPGASPRHLELVQDPGRALIEGNHLFCSISGAGDGPRAPGGRFTATVSTHVRMGEDGLPKSGEVAAIQGRMRDGLRRLAPEVHERIVDELTASPRTFARFTGRPQGFVGGVPRVAGLSQYWKLSNAPVAPGLHLVGDSVFPGQSTLAAALGGWKLAERIASADGSLAKRRARVTNHVATTHRTPCRGQRGPARRAAALRRRRRDQRRRGNG